MLDAPGEEDKLVVLGAKVGMIGIDEDVEVLGVRRLEVGDRHSSWETLGMTGVHGDRTFSFSSMVLR